MQHLQNLSTRARAAVGVLVAVIAAVGITLGFTLDQDPETGKPRGTVTITVGKAVHVDGADKDAKRDDQIELSPAARDQAEQLLEANAPAGGEKRIELDEPLREPSDGPAMRHEPGTPLAAQEFPGCRTAFVANSSSRNGATPRVIVWHYTVSRRLPGWSDNDALTAMSNRPSAGVSWHFSIGGDDGLCAFNVPTNLKAWTQANANPFAIGIEVIALGNEPRYVEGAGRAKLLAVTRELGRRFKIPMRAGKVDGCRPTRSGIVAHVQLGICGGGHVDINPWLGQLPELIKAAASSPKRGDASLLAGEKRQVACLQSERRSARRHGGWGKLDPSHLRRASSCKRELRKSVAFYRAHPKPNVVTRAERRRTIEAVIAG